MCMVRMPFREARKGRLSQCPGHNRELSDRASDQFRFADFYGTIIV